MVWLLTKNINMNNVEKDLSVQEQKEVNGGGWGIVVAVGFYVLDEYWPEIKHGINDLVNNFTES